MRKKTCYILSGLLIGCSLLLCLSGCFKDHITKTYTIVRPVYTPLSTITNNINGNPGQAIDSVGKLFIKDQYIYLNELNKGVHIIDNSDPSHPTPIAFLNLPGNTDMTVKGNTLYANMQTELLAIDISDPRHARYTGRVHNLFYAKGYVNGGWAFGSNDPTDSSMVFAGWTQKDTTVPSGGPESGYTVYYPGVLAFASLNSGSSSSSSTGVAGSMASMVMVNNYLYTIGEGHSLSVVNLDNAAAPSLVKTFMAGYDLETIYPSGNNLFLGSMEGVFIWDISSPVQPVQKGQFTHGRSCDPVITDGNYAYVTLHAGTTCGGISNELDVLNIQDLMQPSLVKSYPMSSPQGLGKDGNWLFVCDSTSGVKVFDATHPDNLQLITHLGTTLDYDLIAAGNRLIVVSGQGLDQYDYSNIDQIRQLSTLPVKYVSH